MAIDLDRWIMEQLTIFSRYVSIATTMRLVRVDRRTWKLYYRQRLDMEAEPEHDRVESGECRLTVSE